MHAANLNWPILGYVIRLHNHNILLALIDTNSPIINQQALIFTATWDADSGK